MRAQKTSSIKSRVSSNTCWWTPSVNARLSVTMCTLVAPKKSAISVLAAPVRQPCAAGFGMVGSRSQSGPGRVGGRVGVSATCQDRGDRPPETILVLSVETPDGRVRNAGPKHCHQTGRIRGAQIVVSNQVVECPDKLLAGVFRPIYSDLGFRRGSNRAIRSSVISSQVKVPAPGFAA